VRRLSSNGLPLAQFDTLGAADGIVHAVSTRLGGFSPAPWDTLNLSVSTGDAPANVYANRHRLAESVGTTYDRVYTCHQVHGANVVRVHDQDPADVGAIHADALMTDRRGHFLSLRFADCVPILFFDPRRPAGAIAHAGWRGTAENVAGATVASLAEAFDSRPADLLVGIGPSIGPCCYEVGEDTAAHFAERRGGVLRDDGRLVLDLWTLNRQALEDAGVPTEQIEVSGVCTRCHSDEFFSHRAAGGGPSGRFAALLALA
jgi:YfiH family protein